MNNYKLETSHNLRTIDVDYTSKISIPSLFLELQELAGEHAEILGVGKTKTEELDSCWVLTRMQLQIIKPAFFGDKLTYSTWPGKTSGCKFQRFYNGVNENNETIFTASSIWTIINLKTRKIVRANKSGIVVPDTSNILPQYDLPKKSIPLDCVSSIHHKTPVYSDIDTNGHVNNSKYISWICDIFPIEKFKTHYISTIRINYNHEILPSDDISLELFENNDEFFVRGTLTKHNKISFECMGDWKKI